MIYATVGFGGAILAGATLTEFIVRWIFVFVP